MQKITHTLGYELTVKNKTKQKQGDTWNKQTNKKNKESMYWHSVDKKQDASYQYN